MLPTHFRLFGLLLIYNIYIYKLSRKVTTFFLFLQIYFRFYAKKVYFRLFMAIFVTFWQSITLLGSLLPLLLAAFSFWHTF